MIHDPDGYDSEDSFFYDGDVDMIDTYISSEDDAILAIKKIIGNAGDYRDEHIILEYLEDNDNGGISPENEIMFREYVEEAWSLLGNSELKTLLIELMYFKE
jgi:hypothetical protein